MNPMNGIRNETRKQLRPFLRWAKFTLPVLLSFLFCGIAGGQVGPGQAPPVAVLWTVYDANNQPQAQPAAITDIDSSNIHLENGLGAETDGQTDRFGNGGIRAWGMTGKFDAQMNRINWSDGTAWVRKAPLPPRAVRLVSYAGYMAQIQVQYLRDQSTSFGMENGPISAGLQSGVNVPTGNAIKIYFLYQGGSLKWETFRTEKVISTGDVCYQLEGTLASPVVSRCDQTVGATGPGVRQIKFSNEAGFDAQMVVTYYEDQNINGTSVAMPKLIVTGFINGWSDKYRYVNLPANISQKNPVTIALQGSTTVRDSVWGTNIPANFTGNPIPCYKVWGTLFDPQGGACTDTPVAVPGPPRPSAPTITAVNGESTSPAAQLERDCYNLVQNKVAYDTAGHTAWSPGNVVNLCKGTTDPQATVACFKNYMPLIDGSAASRYCSQNQGAVATAMPPTPPASTTGTSGQPTLVNRQARDIDAKNGEVWIIGTHAVGDDYSIYKFSAGNWSALDGAALRIAVDGRGSAWVVSSAGMIFRRINNSWVVIPGLADALARDIAITNSGEVWVVTTRGTVSQYTGSGWTQPRGMNATRIDYFADTNTLQLVDNSGKRWTRESGTSWVIAGDPSGMAADYAEYAVDSDGTRWAIDSSFNIWRLPRRAQ